MNILIKATSSYNKGSGHIYRSVKLAEYLSKSFKIYFFSNTKVKFSNKKNGVNFIFNNSDIKSNKSELEWISNIISKKKINFDCLIIDTNEFLFNPNSYIKNKFKKILQITDIFYNTKNNIKIINQNFYQSYKSNSLLGPKYALVKKPNIKFRKKEPINIINNVSIFFGSSDTKNITTKILSKIVHNIDTINFHIILGSKNKFKDSILENFKSQKNIKFYKKISNMYLHLSKCDVAIGSPGHTNIERMTLGVPTILISANKDQKMIAGQIEKKNYGLYLGHFNNFFTPNNRIKLQNYLTDLSLLNSIRNNLIRSFDGGGYQRVKKEIFK